MGINEKVVVKEFAEDYVEQAFWLWYRNSRPNLKALIQLLPPDLSGHKPAYNTIYKWQTVGAWIRRADELDIQVREQVRLQAIQEKVEMFRRHSEVAKQLIDKGMKYLNTEQPFDKSADAIRAVVSGIEIERTSVGVPEALERLSKMSDETLLQTLQRLTGKLRAEDMVEGEVVEELGDGESDNDESAEE